MKKSIGFDCDDVIAEFILKTVHEYNLIHLDNPINKEDVCNFSWSKCPKIYYPKTFHAIMNQADFYDKGVEPVKNSQSVLKYLQGHFDVYIISNAMSFPVAMTSKFSWLMRHFPFIEREKIIYTKDKSLINVDFLVDDGVHNLETTKAFPILYTAPHNLTEERFHRCNNFDDVFKFFQNIGI